MCCTNNRDKGCCEKPDRLKGRPRDCFPEQIRECHWRQAEHPCAPKSGRVKRRGR